VALKLVDKDGNIITNEETKTKAISKAMTALAMHAHLVAKKFDENLIRIPQRKIDEQLGNLSSAIGDDPNISLYIGFGLFMAMNPEDITGIPEEFTSKAFSQYMKILNSIEGGKG